VTAGPGPAAGPRVGRRDGSRATRSDGTGTSETDTNRALRSRLLPYLDRYRRGLRWGVIAVVLTNVVALIQPQVLRLAVDDLYRGVTAEKLGRYAMELFVIAVVAGVFRYLMRQSVIGISRHLEYDLRNDLFAHLQRQPLQYFQQVRTGEIMSRATNDLASVRMMLGPGVMQVVNTFTVAVIALGFMIAISPKLTLISIVPLALISITVGGFGGAIHRRFEQIQERFARISARVQENLAGVRVVRAFAAEDREIEDFRELNRDYLQRNLSLIQVSGLFHPMLTMLAGVAALVGLYLGGREVMDGRITLGEFVAFTVYLGMLNWPVQALGWVVNLFQRGSASWGRMVELLDVAPAIGNAAGARGPEAVTGRLEFRGLTFQYPGASSAALRDVTFDVPAGATIGLVGHTGSGKSTLLSLVPRLFDPPSGSVLLDGVDVRDLDLYELRRRIAFVTQDPFLFSTTVADNIAYGVPAASRDQVEGAARSAHMDADARAFPSGYDTLVGERGITLSGGQKQRVTIARAVLRDAPILLLDDCLSSVDAATEAAILAELERIRRQRTTLIAAHRVSAVRDADLILVLERGALVERGTHDELVAAGGRYAELCREQQLEEELEAS
jgi:ATP-binding cassette, subfamily B, multidrug efflux pump